MTVTIIIATVLLAIIGFLVGGCKIAKESDKASEKQYAQYIKSKKINNNNTNNKGE